MTKRRLHQARVIRTYWITDADARAVEVWRPAHGGEKTPPPPRRFLGIGR